MTDSLLHEFQFSLFPSIQALCNPLSLSMGGTHDLFLIQEYGRAVDRLQMETYTMFFDWKTQDCQNDYNTQGNLKIQCSPYEITNVIFQRARTEKIMYVWKEKWPRTAKAIRERKKWNWRISGSLTSDYTTNHTNQNSMELVQKRNTG